MTRTSRAVAFFVLAIIGLAPQASARELSSTQIALVLHDGEPGRGAVAAVKSLLIKRFGVASDAAADVGGTGAVRRDVNQAVLALSKQAQGSVDAFVLVSLAARVEDPRIFFRGRDLSTKDPWTWISRDEILDWLGQLPLRSALIIHPACSENGKSPPPRSQTLRREGRPVSVWLLSFCATDTRSSARVKEPTGDGRAVVAQALYDTLRETAEGPRIGIDARDLVDELQRKAPWIRFWLQEPAASVAERFTFVKTLEPQRTAASNTPRLSDAAWQNWLQSMVLRANAGNPAAQGEAVTAIEATVRDPQTPADRRPLAVDALSEIRAEAASAALLALAGDATIDRECRRAALAELVRRRDVAAIRALLGDPDPQLRASALRGSGILKDTEAADTWAAAVEPGNEPVVQIAGVQNLALLKRETDRDRLTALVLNPSVDPRVRSEAITVLGQFASRPETTEHILAQLKDPDVPVRRAAAYALATVPSDDPKRKAVEFALAEALRDRADRVRQGAAFAAGALRAERTVAALARTVADDTEPERVRVAAADALAKIGSPEGTRGLAKASRSNVPGVRRAAVTALGTLGGKEAVDAVVARLDDEDPYVREEAERTIGQARSVDQQTVARGLGRESARVRAAVTKKLDVKDESDRDQLLKLLDDDAPEVRMAAIEGLASDQSDGSVDRLAREIESDNPMRAEGACLALGRIDSDSARRVLFAAARSPDPVRRRNAIRALGSQRDPSVAAVLDEAVNDPDPGVRQAVAAALGRTKTSTANDNLRKLAVDGTPEVRQVAIEELRQSNQIRQDAAAPTSDSSP
jgi:HEAT repeat protein